MKPGLARAVPMGFLGFLLGVLIVFILRGLQGLDPIWDPAVGLILATFLSAFAFVWGMGAYNPAVNQHPHAPTVDQETGLIVVDDHTEDDHHHEGAAEEGFSVFGWSLWQVTFLTIAAIVIVAVIAVFPSGLYLRTTNDPMASTVDIGNSVTLTLPFGGPDVQITQLALFVIFVLVLLGSLAAIGGVIALALYALSSNIKEVNESPDVPLGMENAMLALPSGEEATAAAVEPLPASPGMRPLLRNAFLVIRWVVTFAVLYVLFYYVLIGLVLPNPRSLLTMISLVNAVLVTALLLNTALVLRLLGKGAAWLLGVLRGLPAFLGQK